MKILVLLTALIAAAVAAPSLLGEHREDIQPTQDKAQETFKRDKKSLLEGHHTTSQVPGAAIIEATTNLEQAPAARTFGHKSKPIIIKKKVGYHIYRDSDEEKADSRENCQKEMKVKLCDEANSAKSSQLLRDATRENISEETMQRNIKMAKEAVEHLQRDILELEDSSDAKKMSVKHGKSNAEIREDIEEAKQVLEQIHINFGLDSMSLHKATPNDAESVHGIHLTVAKAEEDRMAQWKEAIENIQRNVELVRDIEDSFKPDNQKTEEHFIESGDQMSASGKPAFKENVDSLHTIQNESLQEKTAEKPSNEGKTEKDMKMAATHLEQTSMRGQKVAEKSGIEDITKHPSDPCNESEIINIDTEQKQHDLNKGSRFDASTLMSMSLKAENDKHMIVGKEDKHFSKPESSFSTDLKTASDLHSFKESETAAKMWNHDTVEKNTKEQIRSWETTDQSHFAKNSEQLEHENDNKHVDTHQREKSPSNKREKSSDMMLTSSENNALKEEKALQSKQDMKHEHNIHNMKSSEITETKHLPLKPTESGMLAKSTDQDAHQSQAIHTIEHIVPHHVVNSAMKSADNLQRIDPHLNGPFDTRWAQDQNMRWSQEKHMSRFDENMAMKAAEGNHNLHMSEFPSNMHLIDQPLRLSHTMKSAGQHPTHFDASKAQLFTSQTLHQLHPQRAHEALAMHGKQSMMDSAMQPSVDMRNAMVTFDQSNIAQWKPQESARAVYASRMSYPASSGGSSTTGGSSGAVGVFPNANTGGCGIPLLLSCSPSVVSGSLTKAQQAPSYSAPAYRNEDEFFHTKRDVTNTSENQISKIKRNPTITKPLPLDKQQ